MLQPVSSGQLSSPSQVSAQVPSAEESMEEVNRQLREQNRHLLNENSLLTVGNHLLVKRVKELKLKLKLLVCFVDEL